MVKAVNAVMKGIDAFITALLCAEVVMVVMQIVSRYVFSNPLNWTDQMCRFVLVWIIMLGFPVIFNKKQTVAFDLVFGKTHGAVRYALEMFICVAGMFFAVIFFLCSIQYVQKSGHLSVPGFPWMKFYMLYSAEVIGSALLFVEMVKETYELIINKIRSRRQAEAE